jgi:hypothetical protein
MAWFYEIRGANDATLRRNSGSPDHDAAKTAAHANAGQMRAYSQAGKRKVHRIPVGKQTPKSHGDSVENENSFLKVRVSYPSCWTQVYTLYHRPVC